MDEKRKVDLNSLEEGVIAKFPSVPESNASDYLCFIVDLERRNNRPIKQMCVSRNFKEHKADIYYRQRENENVEFEKWIFKGTIK